MRSGYDRKMWFLKLLSVSMCVTASSCAFNHQHVGTLGHAMRWAVEELGGAPWLRKEGRDD